MNSVLDWFSDPDAKLTILLIQTDKVSGRLDWTALVPTLVAGVITLSVALLTFWLTTRKERKRRDAERKQAQAADAFSGYHKLSRLADLFGNIENLIDQCYREAKESGLEVDEPFQIVPPFAGRFLEPSPIEAREFRFLMTKEHFQLANDIPDIEQRGANLYKLTEEYSRLRSEFELWIETVPGIKRELSGPIASTALPVEHKAKFEMRAGQLNRILAGIVDHLETDVPRSQKCLTDFVAAAHQVFQSDFPKLDITFQIRPAHLNEQELGG